MTNYLMGSAVLEAVATRNGRYTRTKSRLDFRLETFPKNLGSITPTLPTCFDDSERRYTVVNVHATIVDEVDFYNDITLDFSKLV